MEKDLIHSTVNKNVFIIAEVGSNHAQSLTTAKESIKAAAEAGADAVKFQSLSVHAQYHAPSPETVALHQKIDLPENWYPELQDTARKAGVVFMSSPTYLKAIDCLEAVGVEMYKLASAQVGTFPQLIEEVAKRRKPTFLSTGLVNYAELQNTITRFHKHGHREYTILHCNSIYPPQDNQIQLSQIKVYQTMFQCPVGFSDHSLDITLPVAAVALGATAIEKHFTLDPNLDTPDAPLSLPPNKFAEMCRAIRQTEQALITSPRLALEDQEFQFKQRIEVKLILNTPKQAGERFFPADFTYLRHPTGINCNQEELVVKNFVAHKNLEKHTVLNWDVLKGNL